MSAPDARFRVRVRIAHLYLTEGLVAEAEAELGTLLEEMVAAAAAPAKPARARRSATKASSNGDKPKRRSPEAEAELAAAHRAIAANGGLPAPVGENRTARAFTPTERQAVADYAREHSINDACRQFNLSWPCVREWIDKHPRSAIVGVAQ